jgi:hypothetical protein
MKEEQRNEHSWIVVKRTKEIINESWFIKSLKLFRNCVIFKEWELVVSSKNKISKWAANTNSVKVCVKRLHKIICIASAKKQNKISILYNHNYLTKTICINFLQDTRWLSQGQNDFQAHSVRTHKYEDFRSIYFLHFDKLH